MGAVTVLELDSLLSLCSEGTARFVEYTHYPILPKSRIFGLVIVSVYLFCLWALGRCELL